jgi:hypothetical protein
VCALGPSLLLSADLDEIVGAACSISGRVQGKRPHSRTSSAASSAPVTRRLDSHPPSLSPPTVGFAVLWDGGWTGGAQACARLTFTEPPEDGNVGGAGKGRHNL